LLVSASNWLVSVRINKERSVSERMTIDECQAKAKASGAFDRAEFDFVGPGGRTKAAWLDAYLGAFVLDGAIGFSMVEDVKAFPNIYCENFRIPEATA
jgi:hypothetical protein